MKCKLKQLIDCLLMHSKQFSFILFYFFLFYNKGQYHRQELILSKQSDCSHHNCFSKTLNHLRCQVGKKTRKKEDKYNILINHFLNVKRKRWYRIVNTQEERYMCALYKSEAYLRSHPPVCPSFCCHNARLSFHSSDPKISYLNHLSHKSHNRIFLSKHPSLTRWEKRCMSR